MISAGFLMSSKTCTDCDRVYPITALVCPQCEESFEIATYSRCFALAAALAALAIGALVLLDVLVSFAVAEMLVLSVTFTLILYPLAKLTHKRRDPERRVVLEAGSVWSGRRERALLLLLLAFAAVVAIDGGELGSPSDLVEPSHASIRTAVIAATVIAGLAVCLAAMFDQGLRFFDPRVGNTYVDR